MEEPSSWLLVTQVGQVYVSGPLTPAHPAPKDQYILMQFTGLLDKNGKEIYEGDICKMPTGDYPVQVSWDYSGWEFLTRDDLLAESFSGFHDEYEIIGNIYENPELLK